MLNVPPMYFVCRGLFYGREIGVEVVTRLTPELREFSIEIDGS